uniref:Uncharacterized protein n=1 Tax=Setaria italica TaxID=4555 RepID=K3ZYP9_SETIT
MGKKGRESREMAPLPHPSLLAELPVYSSSGGGGRERRWRGWRCGTGPPESPRSGNAARHLMAYTTCRKTPSDLFD